MQVVMWVQFLSSRTALTRGKRSDSSDAYSTDLIMRTSPWTCARAPPLAARQMQLHTAAQAVAYAN